MSSATSNSNNTTKKKRRYLTQKTLGRGAFGTVYLAKEEGTSNFYAVKETFQDSRYKNREEGILKTVCKHPSIITIFQMFHTHKKDGKYLNIVMEYLPCSLHDVIHKHSLQNKHIPELDIAYYSFQLIRACSYLWRLQICHRDIKPQNIVCDPTTKKIRLCDFGSAKRLNDGEWNKHYICSRFYRAPELLCQLNYYTCAVDCWSLGCVIAEMYLNQPIFTGNNTKDQLKSISKILGPIPTTSYPDPIKLKTAPKYRVSAKDWQKVLGRKICSADAADFISNLLCYIPSQRFDLSTLKCLNHPFTNAFITQDKDQIMDKYPKVSFIDNEVELLKMDP
eukprot:108964_1